jgi:chloride channel protein, CIC family
VPLHWMWWPALGGLAIGIGGYFFPRALGVGYGTIGELLQGELALKTVVGILIVKATIWSFSLGSGTSGGVLAPLLMMGGALGALEAHVLPDQGAGFWPLVAMAAVLGGTMRTPFTALIFSLELTHDFNMLAPLLAGCIVAYGFTVLFLKRSILTEKVSRRGLHLSREYSVDPLELHFVRDIVSTPGTTDELPLQTDANGTHGLSVDDYETVPAISAVATLRTAARVMARSGATRLVVVHPDRPQEVAGVIELHDLLKAYRKNLDIEETRTRHLELPGWRKR